MNWFKHLKSSPNITPSILYDDSTFYQAFFKVLIITRDPSDLDAEIRDFATDEIMQTADMGIDITLLKGNHHRKLSIIDRSITWEGSLNILSQNNSMEIMRRIEDKKTVENLMKFLKLKV